jgi:hypothetical protein
MKRNGARTTIGAVVASAGVVLALGSGAVLAVVGDDGTVGSGRHELSTPTAALVSEAAHIGNTDDIASAVGTPKIGLESSAGGGKHVFVGVGPKADVDRYLAGVAVDRVTDLDLDPYKVHRDRQPGSARATPPASQSFWAEQSSGSTANVDWNVSDGSYRFVVMNADGTPGVATDSRVDVGAPYLSAYALAGLLLGFTALTGGIVLMTPAFGRRPDAPAPLAPSSAPAG